MKILVTGSKGFVGKNLVLALRNVQEKKDRTRDFIVDEIYECDKNTDLNLLDQYCKDADFVFHLAGVNRPQNSLDFMTGNVDFSSILLDKLKKHKNTSPIMLASSIQATLLGRYAGSEYGKSKLVGEELFFDYSKETGARVLVYRFPNIFGKWCRPNYNSAVATFCHNMANDIPIQVNDPNIELELLYIDDLISELFDALQDKEHRCEFEGLRVRNMVTGRYCYVPTTYRVTLTQIVELLNSFKEQPDTLLITEIPMDSFSKKLYSTYLSYLPTEKIKFELKMNCDERGSFTELLRTRSCGQFSVNVSKPGITKGQHWHHSKWEFFIVVSGHALIQERKVGWDEKGELYPTISFEVSGEKMEAVHMLPGYTHNIINLSENENLVTVMWANEPFDNQKPDTFFEIV